MLNLTQTRIRASEELPFDTAATNSTVGCILVQGSSVGTVKPGTGASGELFVGVSLSQPLSLTNYPRVESLTVNASNQITLSRTPLGSTLRLIDSSNANTVQTAGTPASNANQYSISGTTVTLNSATQGHAILATYQYSPTTLEARTLQGDVQPGGAASLTIGTVGVIRAGTVYTTEYDTTVDWTAANPAIKCGSSARFTIGGSGASVPNAQVIQAPSTSDALLGVAFAA